MDPTTKTVTERVGGFIIRQCPEDRHELLLFRELEVDQELAQIPGGGIDPGESPEEALHREIYEESGLINLPIVRKLGVFERCWLDSHTTTRRHYFLLKAPATTDDRWDYVVQGKGTDAGFRFSYFWQRPPIGFSLTDSCRLFLSPSYIPELF